MESKVIVIDGDCAGVYAIQHMESKAEYIGQSMRLDRRYHQHCSLLRTGKHFSPLLQDHWNRDGENAFLFVPLRYADSRLFNTIDVRVQLLGWERMYICRRRPVYNAIGIPVEEDPDYPPNPFRFRERDSSEYIRGRSNDLNISRLYKLKDELYHGDYPGWYVLKMAMYAHMPNLLVMSALTGREYLVDSHARFERVRIEDDELEPAS